MRPAVGKSANLESAISNELDPCHHACRHDVILLPLEYTQLVQVSVHACLVCLLTSRPAVVVIPPPYSYFIRLEITLSNYIAGKRLLMCSHIVLGRPDTGEWYSEV